MNPITVFQNSNNWNDFNIQLRAMSNKEKGDCFEVLTKYFLKLNPLYATKLRDVWLLKEVPPKVAKSINLPPSDEGIDLIAETRNGSYWAIQSKYRDDETQSLTRKELSTFTDLAFNICKNIELGLVCTTTNRFSQKLKMHGNKLSFCSGEVWRELDDEFFSRLNNLMKGCSAPLLPLQPRPHQQSAILSANNYFKEGENDRGKMIMPCGTGKSLTGFWISSKLNAKSVVVAVPSLALAKQTIEVWLRECLAVNKNLEWVAICSDETVTEVEDEDVFVLAQDLGIRVESDIDDIKNWLDENRDQNLVVFTTYQSGKKIGTASKALNFTFDFGVFDEAHRTVGMADGLFSHLLFDENIDIRKRLFMTATERCYKGSSDEIVSMNDLSIYGECFMEMSFKDALDAEPPLLSDYKIVTILIDHEEVKDLIDKNIVVNPSFGKWNKQIESRHMASLIALRKAMELYPITHAVSFHSRVEGAKNFQINQDMFSKTYPKYEGLDTYHVSGNMPSFLRSQNLSAFVSSKKALVTNARCLSEGVDIPKIDCILFADPKNSPIDIVQAVGRALRLSQGKKFGYVIVPIVLWNADQTFIQQEDFDNIMTILRALGSSDDRIIEYFDLVAKGKKTFKDSGPIDFHIPGHIAINADKFISSIEVTCWDRIKKLSKRPFWEARDFVHSLKLMNKDQWILYCWGKLPNYDSKPPDIPSNPNTSYLTKGWLSWVDWLGNECYFPFEKAREIVRGLDFQSKENWKEYCRDGIWGLGVKPIEIPNAPQDIYKDKGWVSWSDWLGINFYKTKRQWCSFLDALNFAGKLELKSQAEWSSYCEGKFPDKPSKPNNIPENPDEVYLYAGWLGWKDWLKSDRISQADLVYKSFIEAFNFVQGLGLKSNEWSLYCQGKLPDKGFKPDDIPDSPSTVYAGQGWESWSHWLLGESHKKTNKNKKSFRSYIEARDFVHSLNLKSSGEWILYSRGLIPNKPTMPSDIPKSPSTIYKFKGWAGIRDWLGPSCKSKKKIWLPLEEAKKFVHKLELKNTFEWKLYCKGQLEGKGKRPDNIPSIPLVTYKKEGLKSTEEWLGPSSKINSKKKIWLPLEEAKKFVHKLELKNVAEWELYCKGQLEGKGKRPDNIPPNPVYTYWSEGLESMAEWLSPSYNLRNKND
jgi:superfamily II DNA or RNA helicase